MDYRIVEGTDRIGVGEAAALLKHAYWACRRPVEKIEKSMRNSACYGIRAGDDDRLVGFARVISDYATTWYLCDVVIDPEYRGRGLGKALVSHIASLPEYTGLRGLLLTRDAHGLYARYGFTTAGDRAMSRNPDTH